MSAPRGRPLGSTTDTSPEGLLRREMLATAKLAVKTRELLAKQLAAIEKKMDLIHTTTEETIQLGKLLPEILAQLSNSVMAGAKLLVPREDRDVEEKETSTEKILADLQGRKG